MTLAGAEKPSTATREGRSTATIYIMIVEGEDATVVAQKCTRLTELHLEGAPAASLLPALAAALLQRPNVGRSAGGEVLG